jgi:hypothetical protein
MSLKVFISYAAEDRATCKRVLAIGESQRGVEVLVAERDVPPGDQWRATLVHMINIADIVIAIITEQSRRSEWVLYELVLAQDRNKFIILLVSKGTDIPFFLRQYQAIRYEPNDNAGFDSKATERQELSNCLKSATIKRGALLYPLYHLRERCVTRIPFLVGLLIANLGFVVWWAIDKVWELYVRSSGGDLAASRRISFDAPWPSIWAASSLFFIYVAVWLTVRLRRGTIQSSRELTEWIWGALLFLVTTASAGYAFYDLTGLDDMLRGTTWSIHTKELFSTMAWSAMISTIAVLPFVVSQKLWRHVLSWRPLLRTIFTTVATSVLALFVYFAYVQLNAGGVNDTIRGLMAGAGLRSGMFIGMYFAGILSSIRENAA